MKKSILVLFGVLVCMGLSAQARHDSSSITRSLQVDEEYIERLCDTSDNYLSDKPDTSLLLAQKARQLAKQINYKKGEARVLFIIGKVLKQKGIYLEAIKSYQQSKAIYESIDYIQGVASDILFIGEVHYYQGNYPLSLTYYFQAKEVYEQSKMDYGVAISCLKISDSYVKLHQLDSANYYLQQIANLKGDQETISSYLDGKILLALGNIYLQQGNLPLAEKTFRQSFPLLLEEQEQRSLCQLMLSMAELFQKKARDDSSLNYANQSFTNAKKAGFMLEVLHASDFLSRYYKAHRRYDSAFAYLEITTRQKDSLFDHEKTASILLQQYQDDLQKKSLAAQQEQVRYRNKIFALLAAFLVLLSIAFLLWRNNKQKHKANLLLQKQKQEVQKTLSELKAVQQQLIHTEKMASLGEVTAGIAHEIQNPLNFITNFSDVGNDLLQELKEELKTGDAEQALKLTPMIEQSFQKISEHGQRADAIVKNMMQHARKNTGIREPADVNAIVGDCLRLSYQGARTKDASFQANLKTQFDTSLGKINMVPQDMGRVLVNLFNNAFYSVQQKKKQAQNGYEPSVQVTTRKNGDSCEIRIKDNGLGIQEKVVDKIYQPFFTTKPAGEGTGLGLSMSYEIVTKAHGGQLKVNTQQGEYAEFIVELPLQ